MSRASAGLSAGGLAVALLLAIATPCVVRSQEMPVARDDGTTASDADPTDAPAPEPAPTAPAADAGVTELPAGAGGAYRLEVRAPGPLRALLVRHLDVSRFREQTDVSPAEVGRLLAATPAQTRALLEAEGYFDVRVDVQRVEAADGAPPLLRVDVTPGAQARVARVQLELQGAMAEGIGAGDPAVRRRWERLQARWTLPVGAPFSQKAWDRAKADLLAALHQRDFATASLAGTGAEVDAEKGAVRLFVVVDSGPRYRVGEVRVEGLVRTPRDAALNVMPFSLGEPYDEKMLLDYQTALQKTGLYAGVAVELDPDPARADRAAVVVRLREQTLQSATPSIGYSSNTGPRVGLEHTTRRLFDRDLVGTTRLKLGRDERSLSYDLLTYPQPGNYRNLLSLQADYLSAGGAVTQTQRVRVGRSRDTGRIDRTYYLEFNRTNVETETARTTDRAVLGNYEWVRRDVDSLVFPTRGLILSAQAGGGYAHDASGSSGPFTRLYLQAVWYRPLGAGWLGLLRGEAADVLRRNSLGVPDSLLFRAGGDNSVRGYGYRTLGPVRDGSVVGGPVMATGTVEVMHRLSSAERWRDWFGAVFVDAGNAAANWDELKPALGYGVGLRWRSPIGPLRTDIAYGRDVRAFRLHLSVGVSF